MFKPIHHNRCCYYNVRILHNSATLSS